MATLFLALLTLLSYNLNAAHPLLILDAINRKGEMPAHFRTTSDAPCTSFTPSVSQQGLEELHISGSGQFAQEGLLALLKKLRVENLTIIDLRQESHGFANGSALSWFIDRNWINKGKSLKEIEKKERALLDSIKKQHITFYEIEGSTDTKLLTLKLFVKSVQSEEELCKDLKVRYLCLPTTDHVKPEKEVVEQFIAFARNLSSQDWLHFHCRAGDGRTTTFMAMFDMMQNAKDVSFQSIIARQNLLGGIALSDLPSPDSWKYPYENGRLDFLIAFYEYCRTNQDGFKTLF